MYVLPKLKSAGWNDESIREQMQITAGRIIPEGRSGKRLTPKKPDYVLFYAPNFKIAVVEAKSEYNTPGQGMQQAIDYAKMLDLKFAYSTNGKGIEEYDFIAKKQTTINKFPTPEKLWERLNKQLKLSDKEKEALMKPFNREAKSPDGRVIEPRYYQEIAINAAMTAILHEKKKVLLTLATGTGKTFIAFQIARKLWETRSPHPKILFLADRDILISLDRPIITTGIKVARISSSDLPSLLLQRVARVRFRSKELLRDYFFFWLQSSQFMAAINPGRSNGVPHISSKEIENIPFSPPSPEEQANAIRVIADIYPQFKVLYELIDKNDAAFQAFSSSILNKLFKDKLTN